MSYPSFSLSELQNKFAINLVSGNLFESKRKIAPSSWLEESLSMTKIIPLSSEKSRSELIVMPILAETVKRNQEKISMFSGMNLDADKKNRLYGECDFILCNKPNRFFLEAAIFSLVEAKKNDIELGLPQCIAQMIGAQTFNKKNNLSIEHIYGCVTTGEDWQFLRLSNQTITIDSNKLFLNELTSILGIMQEIIDRC